MELIGQILLYVALGIALVAGGCGLCVVTAALLPRVVERSARRGWRRPWLQVTLGLLVSAPWVLASLMLLQRQGGVALLGALVMSVWFIIAIAGASGLCCSIGRAWRGCSDTPARDVSVGGLALFAACCLPLVGWFLILPAVLVSGVGGLMLGMIQDDRDAAGSNAGLQMTGSERDSHDAVG